MMSKHSSGKVGGGVHMHFPVLGSFPTPQPVKQSTRAQPVSVAADTGSASASASGSGSGSGSRFATYGGCSGHVHSPDFGFLIGGPNWQRITSHGNRESLGSVSTERLLTTPSLGRSHVSNQRTKRKASQRGKFKDHWTNLLRQMEQKLQFETEAQGPRQEDIGPSSCTHEVMYEWIAIRVEQIRREGLVDQNDVRESSRAKQKMNLACC